MANTKSAAKRSRQTETRTLQNKSVLTGIRTQEKKFAVALKSGDATKVTAEYDQLASRLDKASKRNVVHKNLASRKKSAASKKIAQLKSKAE
jgi:small subunit ribosomal protein S20